MDAEARYHLLFNRITDAIEELEALNFGRAKEILILAQQDAENGIWRKRKQTKQRHEKAPPGRIREGLVCDFAAQPYAICLAALIFTPGPMVLAVTQERIYWPLAAAGFALMTAPMRVR